MWLTLMPCDCRGEGARPIPPTGFSTEVAQLPPSAQLCHPFSPMQKEAITQDSISNVIKRNQFGRRIVIRWQLTATIKIAKSSDRGVEWNVVFRAHASGKQYVYSPVVYVNHVEIMQSAFLASDTK